MDFRHQQTTVAGVSAFSADALLLVVAGTKVPSDLPRPLAQALQAAVQQGDLALENGRSLYLGRQTGVKAPRLAVAVAGDALPKLGRARPSWELESGYRGSHIRVQ